MSKPEKVWLALTDIGIMVYEHSIDASSAEVYGAYYGAYVPEESTLSHAIVAAVRAYQTSFASVTGADTSEVDNGNLREFRREMLEAIEADAKEREG